MRMANCTYVLTYLYPNKDKNIMKCDTFESVALWDVSFNNAIMSRSGLAHSGNFKVSSLPKKMFAQQENRATLV